MHLPSYPSTTIDNISASRTTVSSPVTGRTEASLLLAAKLNWNSVGNYSALFTALDDHSGLILGICRNTGRLKNRLNDAVAFKTCRIHLQRLRSAGNPNERLILTTESDYDGAILRA